MLLLARIIQACASGLLIAFQLTVLVSIYPPEKRGTILGLSGLVISSGPAFGPTISGIIIKCFSWRYIFILVFPIMLIVLLIGFWKFPNFKEPENINIDISSILLSIAGAGLTLASLTVLKNNMVAGCIMLLIGVAILYIFVRRQCKLKNPLLKVKIFKVRSFRIMTIICVLTFMVLFGTEQMVPIFTESILKLNSMQSGLVLLPGALLNAFAAVIVGRIYDNYGPKYLIIGGAILMIIGGIPFVLLNVKTPVWILTIFYAIRLTGNSLIFSPAMSESFKDLSLETVSHGTALNNTLQQAFGSIAVTVLVIVADLPSSLTIGIRTSFWITMLLTVLVIIALLTYERKTN